MCGRVLSQWWDGTEAAGPRSRPTVPFGEAPPDLEVLALQQNEPKCLAWCNFNTFSLDISPCLKVKCAQASNKTNTYKSYNRLTYNHMSFLSSYFVFSNFFQKFPIRIPSALVQKYHAGVPRREAHITSGFFEGRNWDHWGPQSLQQWWWFYPGVQCPCHSPGWSHLGFSGLARRTASQLQEAFRVAASPSCRLQVQPHVLELNPECFHHFAFKFWCPVCSEHSPLFNH